MTITASATDVPVPGRFRLLALSITTLAVLATVAACNEPPRRDPFPRSREWPAYLGGLDSAQYSPLDEITPANVARLEVAWIYGSGDADAESRSQIQCNPLVIDGILYGTSPTLRLFALDAESGEELWAFDPFAGGYRLYGLGVNRGLAAWSDDGGSRRILYSAGSRLHAIDAATGEPIASFGEDGSIDLHVGLDHGLDPGLPGRARELFVVANTPGVVFEDLYILGTRVAESLPAAPGDVRAFDVRSGELRWSFRTVPASGDLGAETWPAGARFTHGGANSWAGMSLDSGRGLVYVPTGSAAYDFFGGDRAGANLFANTLLALDARSGERRWHYQVVHHDLWDRDLPAPPNLVSLEREGRTIDAVAQITKSGHVFVFDRDTGETLFPIDEVPVPPSDLAGEQAWPTQPLPRRPPPFARQRLSEEQVTDLDPEAHSEVLERLRRLRSGGQFTPPSLQGTVIFPGFDGGGEWGGAAWDPESQILYVNASEMPWVLTMFDAGTSDDGGREARRLYAQQCALCHGPDLQGDPLGVHPPLLDLSGRHTQPSLARLIVEGRGAMPSFAHLEDDELEALVSYLFDSHPKRDDLKSGHSQRGDPEHLAEATKPRDETATHDGGTTTTYTSTGYHRFLDRHGYPAVKPPWGTLTAIDLARGELLWQVPLGEVAELSARGLPPTGTENYGGPVVTAGGLVFIAATRDDRLRAFDKRSGELLWQAELPAGGYATPAVYEAGGRQHVVIAAGGGKMGTPSGDAYVAYRLP